MRIIYSNDFIEMLSALEPYLRTNPKDVTDQYLSEDAPDGIKRLYQEFQAVSRHHREDRIREMSM